NMDPRRPPATMRTETQTPARTADPRAGFRHEALFYAGEDDFVRRTAPFVRDAVRSGDPILVAVPGPRTQLLRDALGADARRVRFADMAEIGRNPARIIPVWC